MMRATSFALLILGLVALLSMSASKATAQFRAAPPVGGFNGPGVYGPPAGLSGGLGAPELGNGIGGSGFGNSSFNHDLYVLPDSNITVNASGAASGGSPPPPSESRWNGPYFAASPSDQNRENLTPSSSNEVRSTPAKPTDATIKEPSGWRWKWWHGLLVLVIIGLVMAGRKQ